MSEFKLCELCAKQDCKHKGYNPIMCGMFKIKCCANCDWSETYGKEQEYMSCRRVSWGLRDYDDVEPTDYCSMCWKPKEE